MSEQAQAVEEQPLRGPHAILDRPSRLRKAEKIIGLLESHTSLRGQRVLEIGCGAGYLSMMLAEVVGPDGHVSAVDVHDSRMIRSGFDFILVSDTALPFPDASFDVVISNHVIEHVGERRDQSAHLAEIRRVLSRDGLCFLSLPNSRFPYERHFRLPFLSQLPRRLRSPYVRLMGRGADYDCDIPSPRAVRALARSNRLGLAEITDQALSEFRKTERPNAVLKVILRMPDPVLRLGLWIAPSKTYLLTKAA